MGKVANNSVEYKTEIMSAEKVAAKVEGIRNGLNTNDEHLKVNKIHTIFKIYDDLTNLVSSYGKMIVRDLKEFNQVGVNIENTDREAK